MSLPKSCARSAMSIASAAPAIDPSSARRGLDSISGALRHESMPLPMNLWMYTLKTNDLRISGSLAQVTDIRACSALLTELERVCQPSATINMALPGELDQPQPPKTGARCSMHGFFFRKLMRRQLPDDSVSCSSADSLSIEMPFITKFEQPAPFQHH